MIRCYCLWIFTLLLADDRARGAGALRGAARADDDDCLGALLWERGAGLVERLDGLFDP
ncbi:MAG: hypothetical protein KJO70_05975 [Gammaproteobacteria bacterium]|nr:hypothetical protein [Gammaproteobacteria bacterium]